MIAPDIFEQLWHKFDDYTVNPPPVLEPVEDDPRCIHARHFDGWVADYCQDVLKRPDLIAINQTMLLLLKKYFEWRVCVPRAHRDRIGERGHVCIFHCFERTYQQLKVAELSLKPPMLFLPPKPPRPPKPAPPAPVMKLPEELEKALTNFGIGQILGEET